MPRGVREKLPTEVALARRMMTSDGAKRPWVFHRRIGQLAAPSKWRGQRVDRARYRVTRNKRNLSKALDWIADWIADSENGDGPSMSTGRQ